MGVVRLPDALKQAVDRQVAEGQAASATDFLTQAVERYAEALESDQDEIAAAAEEGIADIEAGRFELISTQADMARLWTELRATLDRLAGERTPTSR